MAIETPAQQLERVQRTIAQIEERGQAVGAEGHALTRADLRTLYEREAQLLARVNRKARGGIRLRRGVPLG